MVNLLEPWRRPGQLARSAAFVATGLPAGIVAFVTAVTMSAVSVSLFPVFPLAIPVVWVTAMVVRGMARIERQRVGSFLDPIPDAVPALTAGAWWRRLMERLRNGARWREFGYCLASLPLGTVGYVVVFAIWSGSIALVLLPAVAGSLPGDSAKFFFFEATAGGAETWALAALGLFGSVIVAPWVTIAVSRLEWIVATALLGPTAKERTSLQVSKLETSRAAAVDSAESERRRIERDLHDGAQQRLVALAANLGAAREKLDDDPEVGRRMVDAAHTEAKAALAEIRDLVRGIHPVILADRGIDAALSAVVARSPVPVELDVQIVWRPPPAVESAAYFVVSEALTNVARHSGATRATVSIAQTSDRLVVEIRDDGHGGADTSLGTGLQGLRDRVAGLDGTMHVISPRGGPTTISVELPCGS
ncbi:MAG: sensor histidine kinase [Ilumatobacter sp.]|uniref:sensor histidine kinase n=1 Tax=Ilumatobacter sp. TaxID=1967498 RepID=UPI00329742C7